LIRYDTVARQQALGCAQKRRCRRRHCRYPAPFPRLGERLDGRAGLLSSGGQQMLAIARGLMANPRILMLDEPSLGLAPAMTKLYAILADLRDDGATVLLVDQMATLALAEAVQ
jgi:branched-chain amino acid transport system ATP-binding protein/branched-chain amino acid transport system permease protein